jgi:aspartate/methionine/tyrosine aminotransferase
VKAPADAKGKTPPTFRPLYGQIRALLEAKGVACVPGESFGEPRALRISYTCPTPQLAPGLQRFKEFFAELN